MDMEVLMAARKIRTTYEPLADLAQRGREDNPKDHDVEAIEESVKAVGYIEPVVINERDGRILSGHGRVETLLAMEARGDAAPDGVTVTRAGVWKVPVVRGVDLDEEDAQRYVLAANQTTIAGGWEEEGLEAMLSSLAETEDGLAGTGFIDDDLIALQAALNETEAEPEENEVPDVADEPYVEVGQIYALGPHRVMCGDATVPEQLARLLAGEKMDAVVTDPPYAIYGSSSGLSSSVTDDKIVRPFFRDALRAAEVSVKLFGHVYIFCDWRSWPSWWEMAKGRHLEPKNLLVWTKNGSGLGNNYANTYELIGFFTLMPEQHTMTSKRPGGQRQVLRPNVISANRPTGDERQHNAAKPIELLEELIANSTDANEVVLDPFLGSGSTTIAAERLGRRCYGMDIEPEWAQVAIERWERFTGEKAELLDG